MKSQIIVPHVVNNRTGGTECAILGLCCLHANIVHIDSRMVSAVSYFCKLTAKNGDEPNHSVCG